MDSLVVWGLFHDVGIAFLPVGNTTEDIAHKFRHTSDRLRNHDATILCYMSDHFSLGYNDETTVSQMKHAVNLS